MAAPKKFDLPRYLQTLPLFSSLSVAECEQLAANCSLRRHERQDVIFRMGEPCRAFHGVVLGRVKLFAVSPAGAEKIMRLCGPGDTFGEAVMLLEKDYVVTAQALEPTLLLSIDRSVLVDAVERHPPLAMHMLAGLSQRLYRLVGDVKGYALRSGSERIIGFLLSERMVEGDREGPGLTIRLPVSKAAIASRLSVTPEYFSRVLGELTASGLIEVRGREIHVPDVGRLSGHLAG